MMKGRPAGRSFSCISVPEFCVWFAACLSISCMDKEAVWRSIYTVSWLQTSVDKFVEYPYFVHFPNYFRSYSIHRSQYSPIQSQFWGLFPPEAGAIIPSRLRQATPTAQVWFERISSAVHPPHINQGGIAMKITMKQLLINAMEEYGSNLIHSDRF